VKCFQRGGGGANAVLRVVPSAMASYSFPINCGFNSCVSEIVVWIYGYLEDADTQEVERMKVWLRVVAGDCGESEDVSQLAVARALHLLKQ
jgi:hypothetical protein